MEKPNGVFADNALDLYRHGLCVVPIGLDRQPCVNSFQKWRRRPGRRALMQWIEVYGQCNIAIVPGFTDLVVVDSDDADQDAAVQELFGTTPLCVFTRRGRHRYYRHTGERLPSSLRRVGFQVDLKIGRSLVIAPPSLHESGIRYRLDDCDWSALGDVPPLMTQRLHALMEHSRNGKRGRPELLEGEMRDGSRGLWLNDQLCAQANGCGSFDELLELAWKLNSRLASAEFEPLPAEEVVRRARQVWQDIVEGKIQSRAGLQGVSRAKAAEIDLLCQQDARHGPNALLLLLRLRALHSPRCRRGETFSITPRAMVEGNVVPGWTRERYEKARDVLLRAQLVIQVAPFRHSCAGRQAAQYTLPECQRKHRYGTGAGS